MFVVPEDRLFVLYRLGLAQALIRRGWEVALVCEASDCVEQIRAAGITVIEAPLGRTKRSPRAVWRAARRLRRIIRDAEASLVQVVSLRAILMAWLATVGTRRVPFVNAVTGMGSLFAGELNSWRWRILRAVVNGLLKPVFSSRSAYNVFQNQEDHDRFVARGLTRAERAWVIRGSGVEPGSWTPREEPRLDPPVILYIGRYLRDKGLAELIAASVSLRQRGVAHRLRLAGQIDPGNPASFTEADARSWAELPGVELLGWRSDVLEQLSQANVVALPSYREGLPKTLLEAGLARRAVVTTDVVGCREVVTDGVNGLVVPARDADALAAALARLLRDPALRARLSEAHHARVCREFSLEVVTEQFCRLYKVIETERMAARASKR